MTNRSNSTSFYEADLMDIIDDVSAKGDKVSETLDKVDTKMDQHVINAKSIVARSRNSVLQFPVYCTQSIRVNEAQIISKLFERVYTSFVQTALAQNPVLEEDEVNNLVFLQKFHTNLKESTELKIYNEYYTPIDTIDEMVKESVYYSEWVTPTMNVEFKICAPDQDLVKENARLINEPLTGLRYLQEADRLRSKDAMFRDHDDKVEERETKESNKRLTEDEIKEIAMKDVKLNAVELQIMKMSREDMRKDALDRNPDMTEDELNDEIRALLKIKNEGNKKIQQAIKDFKDDAKKSSDDPTKKIKRYEFDGTGYIDTKVKVNNQKVTTRTTKALTVKAPIEAPKLLRDADIKKINGMLPYTIDATFRVRAKNGVGYDVHFIIGVKTVLHLINVNDLKDDLQEIITGNIKSLQKVRYKTGEIKFMDYIFNFKGLKKDAAKRINYNKKWINSLKRMADYNKLNGTMYKKATDYAFKGSVAIPNGTIILSQSDVTSLIDSTGIDLGKVSNAKRLAKSLFLIAVAIVDPSAGSMKVLFPDSDNDWDIQSLAAIDAELAKTDNSQIMRELNRMVNK